MVRLQRRYGLCWTSSGAPRVRRLALKGNSLLRRTACGSSRNHRLGSGALQVRQHGRGCERETPVRLVLHQERVHWFGCPDHVPNHQNRVAGPGGAVRWAFWGAVVLLLYAYVGYLAWLWFRARWCAVPVNKGLCEPFVSIVMVVRDEERVLETKIQNLLGLEYPVDRIELVIVSDGSRD